MAIDTTKSWQEFTADGSTAYFAFNFNYVDDSEIRVGIRTAENTYAEVPKEQYQIIKNASTNGGQIRFIQNPSGSEDIDKNPTAGTIVRIERVSPLTSDATWQVGLDMTQMIQLFDSLYRLVQESRGILDNSVQSFKTQHGLTIAELLQKHNDYLLFFDFDSKQFKPTSFTQTQVQKVIDEAVRSAGLTVKNMEWDGNKLSVSFNSGSKNAVVSDNIMQVKAEQNTKGEWIFKYSMDGTTWKAVTETLLHNTLQGRDDTDCHPISAITDLQEELDKKANTESTYNKTEVDEKLKLKADKSDTYSKDETYSKTEVDDALKGKLSIQQRTSDSGKVVKVGADGNLVLSSESGGLLAVSHGKTLKGAGTDLDPLDVADGAIGNTQLAEEVKDEIAGKQPKGNYATEEELTQGLATKQPAGNYATKDELAKKAGLADNQTFAGKNSFTQTIGSTAQIALQCSYTITAAETTMSRVFDAGNNYIVSIGALSSSTRGVINRLTSNNNGKQGFLELCVDNSGNILLQLNGSGASVNLPTSDNSSNIPTTSWVKKTMADKDLSNVSANIDYVVESNKRSDGTWYRKYKSGWLEQGGIMSTGGEKTQTITYPKPFAGVERNIMLFCNYNASWWANYSEETATGVTITRSSTAYTLVWVVRGISA